MPSLRFHVVFILKTVAISWLAVFVVGIGLILTTLYGNRLGLLELVLVYRLVDQL